MRVPFTKMHGLGNDFIFVDVRNTPLPKPEEFSRKFGDRRFGIGADQILLVGKSTVGDLKMEIYTQDGSKVEMCGNGIRCFAKYVADRALPEGRGKDVLNVETLAGIIRPRRLADGRVEVDMGEPRLKPDVVPVKLDGERVVDREVTLAGAKRRVTCVSMGNPHAVFFVDDVAAIDLEKVGPAIETDALFPRKTNVEFVQVLKDGVLLTRVWERGAGITLACGTGACAVGVAAVLNQKAARKNTVRLPGGDLAIEWRESDNRVYMTGPASEVFSGEVEWNPS
ncbi:MAG TPA: diaminopimelate epimerase [bacterium]|nr:diaminopimelate epimerase [bacterium]